MAKIWKGVLLIFIASILIVGCGGGDKSAEDEAPAVSAPKKDTPKEVDPVELGRQIGDIYIKALKDVTEMLKDKPPVEEIQAGVEELRENVIMELVELGKKRENLDEAGRAQADSQIRMKINPAYNEAWYSTYNEVQQHYFQNRELHKLIMDFNIIGQYANFDLLRKQAPDEAKRLGIVE